MMKCREKMFNKGLAFALALSMLAAPFSSVYLNVSAMVNTSENYVVVTSDNLNSNKLTEVLDLSMIDVENNNVISTAELSKRQASLLKANKEVLALEKDIVLKGSAMIEKSFVDSMDIEGPVLNLTEEYLDTQTLAQHEATTEGLPVKDKILWNLEMIGVSHESATLPVQEKVKVAMLDSGVDYLDNIDVKEKINLIPDTEISPLFEDYTGHGTAIASILVGNYDNVFSNVKGVNPNIELYSARVLDENNEAPLSRVLEGIYWAIDKNVDIINISFGSEEYSESLKMAIDDAVSRGILVIAAAGNNGVNGAVEYPAAFENVVSVGAVNSQGYLSEVTSTGGKLDVVAPGMAVRVTSFFGEEALASGTSIAVPHVVGLASLIWQEDLSKDSQFVRTVLEKSSKALIEETMDIGLIDYNYARLIYDTIEEQYNKDIPINVLPNETEIRSFDNFEDEMVVKGSWKAVVHREYLNSITSNADIEAMKLGAVYQDGTSNGLYGMILYPEWHGYFRLEANNEPTNYVAIYRYLIKIGNEYGKGNDYTAVSRSDIPGLSVTAYDRIRTAFSYTSSVKLDNYIKNKYSSTQLSCRKAFVFGMAMHTATDTFAHSTYQRSSTVADWKRIKHVPEENPAADDTSVKPRRYTMALRVERNVVYRFQGNRADVPVGHDFHASGDTTGVYYSSSLTPADEYLVANLRSYAESAGVTDTTVLNHYGMITINTTNYNGVGD